MRYVHAGGVDFSSIGLGTWQFGSKEWGYGSQYALVTSIEILHQAIELGVNFIDTAEMYGFGASESIIGDALEGRDDDGLYVATKFMPILPIPPVLIGHAYRSATRLKTDTIDLYQLHFPNPLVPLSAQLSGLRTLLERGVVKNVGVSNYSLAQWIRAEKLLGSPILTNQVHFSLLTSKAMDELIPWAQTHDRIVIAYSPLEQGLLSGKYTTSSRPAGFRRLRRAFSPSYLRRISPLLSVMTRISETKEISVAQCALAWIGSFSNVVAIPGASSVRQLQSNVAASDVKLDAGEIADLTEAALALGRH